MRSSIDGATHEHIASRVHFRVCHIPPDGRERFPTLPIFFLESKVGVVAHPVFVVEVSSFVSHDGASVGVFFREANLESKWLHICRVGEGMMRHFLPFRKSTAVRSTGHVRLPKSVR